MRCVIFGGNVKEDRVAKTKKYKTKQNKRSKNVQGDEEDETP